MGEESVFSLRWDGSTGRDWALAGKASSLPRPPSRGGSAEPLQITTIKESVSSSEVPGTSHELGRARGGASAHPDRRAIAVAETKDRVRAVDKKARNNPQLAVNMAMQNGLDDLLLALAKIEFRNDLLLLFPRHAKNEMIALHFGARLE